MWDPTRRNFFGSLIFMQNLMYAGPTNAKGCLNLTIGQMTILQYQLAHSINDFLEQQLDDLHEIRLGLNYDLR